MGFCLPHLGEPEAGHPGESTALRRRVALAAEKHRRGFAAGRLCAAYALQHLGAPPGVGRGTSGQPIWPEGTVGSITHDDGVAYAAVARRNSRFGLGIDSERIVDEDSLRAVASVCCSERERTSFLAGRCPALAGTLIFSTKESIYKAVHPVTGDDVDFLDVEVSSIDWLAGLVSVRAVSGSPLVCAVPQVLCRFRVEAEAVHTSVAFPENA